MKHAKKGKNKEDRKGFEERIQVLERIRPSAGEEIDGMLKATRRNQVARDDIVDAFAAALTATAPEPVTLPPAPPDPPKDSEGLPMEMVYAEPDMIPGR